MDTTTDTIFRSHNRRTAEQCLKQLSEYIENTDNTITTLREDNRKLREEYNKDAEIAELRAEIEQLQKDNDRGFPITEEEGKEIELWQTQHIKEAHNGNEYCGCIGGRFTFIFIPTSIGVLGTVRCSCGAEFTFAEL